MRNDWISFPVENHFFFVFCGDKYRNEFMKKKLIIIKKFVRVYLMRFLHHRVY